MTSASSPLSHWSGGVALFAVFSFAVFSFVAVTLAVGDPFNECSWRTTEESVGNSLTDIGLSWWRWVLGGLRLFAIAAPMGILLFAGGSISVVG